MSQVEYRAVIKFLWKEGLTTTLIKERCDGVYGDSSPSYSTVKRWVQAFRLGREEVEDEPREGRPSTVITPETIALVEEEVLSDSRLKIREIAARLFLSKSTVHRIILDHLHMTKVSARWVPKLLSAVQKQHRTACAADFLERCHGKEKNVIDSIVTGDETMVLYYDPHSKVTQLSKKVMTTIFWDSQGILLINFKEGNTTINDGAYYASIIHKLRTEIEIKRQGKLDRDPLLLHDNAPVHCTAVTKAAVRDCGFTEIEHPPYSPDLAPSDFYLFANLKKSLRGKKFSSDSELQAAVYSHFAEKTSDYFFKGIQMLIQRCEKCVAIKGDYIEK